MALWWRGFLRWKSLMQTYNNIAGNLKGGRFHGSEQALKLWVGIVWRDIYIYMYVGKHPWLPPPTHTHTRIMHAHMHAHAHTHMRTHTHCLLKHTTVLGWYNVHLFYLGTECNTWVNIQQHLIWDTRQGHMSKAPTIYLINIPRFI